MRRYRAENSGKVAKAKARRWWKNHDRSIENGRASYRRNAAAEIERKRRWRENNEEKYHAHNVTKRAIDSGKMSRKPCEVCGAEPSDAHHDDYSRPLEVRWLCRKHHNAEHRSENS